MFERLSTGWAMAKQSFQVLKLDKELLLFPILSGLACVLVLASFATPFLTGMIDLPEGDLTTAQQITYSVLGFAFYFVSYFIIIFFNSALVACAIIRLKGGDPTVRDGIGASMARLPQIAGWALVSATVGMILKAIESRSERVGEIVASLLGMAWSITTFFVVPILVVGNWGQSMHSSVPFPSCVTRGANRWLPISESDCLQHWLLCWDCCQSRQALPW